MMTELTRWLDKLGEMSVQDIRKLMQDEGIKGRTAAYNCPMANFLRGKCGHDVGIDGLFVWGPEVGYVRLPESVVRFVSNFDRFTYPELIS